MSFSSIKVNSLQRFSLNFSANIIAAFWMLLGSVRAFVWVKPSFAQFLCFLTTALLANVLFGWLAADMGSAFNVQGLVSYIVWPAITLVAGIIIARRSQNYALVFVPVVLWLTADTMLMLIQSLIQFLATQNLLPQLLYRISPWLFMLLFIWQTAALLLVFAKKLSWSWWERVLMLVGAIALLSVWQKNIANQPIFKVQTYAPTISEEAFYTQPNLLINALEQISVGTQGVSEWYFLGVAGYGEQEVFANEIREARQLFDVRFGTMGRSLSLINNAHTWQDDPVATRISITQALNQMGARMNAQEDVLFMVLSSHGVVDEQGVPTGQIALDNPPLALTPIDGKWLKEQLDKAGIRWRVIVVSSCYSGAFIDELLNPTTVVITASAANKASFGCSNDAELTYFGRAFFAESMRSQTSFDKAFTYTTQRVAEREALMGFVPSQPQMATGALMKTALPEFEKVLFGYTPPAQDPKSPKPTAETSSDNANANTSANTNAVLSSGEGE